MRFVFCLFMACVIFVAQPAFAAVIVATFVGKIAAGTDGAGIFGAAGANLDNEDFTAVYTADNGISGLTTTSDLGSTIISGPGFIKSVLTIKGISYTFLGTSTSTFEKLNGVSNPGFSSVVLDKISFSTSSPGASIFNFFENGGINFIDNTTFDAPLFYSGGLRFGNFSIAGPGGGTDGSITPDSVTIMATSAVPEPATWLFMMSGFGLAGMHIRARRRNVKISQC